MTERCCRVSHGIPNGRGSRCPDPERAGRRSTDAFKPASKPDESERSCERRRSSDVARVPVCRRRHGYLARRATPSSCSCCRGRGLLLGGESTGGRAIVDGASPSASDAAVRARLKEPSRMLVARPPARDGRPDVDSFRCRFLCPVPGGRPAVGPPPSGRSEDATTVPVSCVVRCLER
jgi:hypothetical protein